MGDKKCGRQKIGQKSAPSIESTKYRDPKYRGSTVWHKIISPIHLKCVISSEMAHSVAQKWSK